MKKKRLLITLGIGFIIFFLVYCVVTLPFDEKIDLMIIMTIVGGVTVLSLFALWIATLGGRAIYP